MPKANNPKAFIKLYKIFYTLLDEVSDSRGYGGPVCHEAEVDGAKLRITQSDFGDLALIATFSSGAHHVLDIADTLYVRAHTTAEDVTYIVSLLDKAEWKDTIKRSTKTAEEYEEIKAEAQREELIINERDIS